MTHLYDVISSWGGFLKTFAEGNNIQSGCPHFLFLFYSVQLCWKQAEEVTKSGSGLEWFLNFPFQHLSYYGAIQTGGSLTNSPLSELTACFSSEKCPFPKVSFKNCGSSKVEVFDLHWSTLVVVMSPVPQSENRCLQWEADTARSILDSRKNILNKIIVFLKRNKKPMAHVFTTFTDFSIFLIPMW